jgi:5-methylcytosine-specific restriction endonuclease McrA
MDVIAMKQCSKCGEWKIESEFYLRSKTGKRLPSCKECERERVHRYYVEHPGKKAESDRRWRDEHPEEAREKNRRYRAEHLDEERERRGRYQAKHPEKKTECQRRYRARHSEELREASRRYHAERPVETRAYHHRRRALEASAPGTHTAADIRIQISAQTDKKGVVRCWWCGCDIGDAYHIDHRVPLSKGGSNAPDNLVIACPTCNLSKSDKTHYNGRLL